jgi:hypothetical protein
VFVSDDGGAAHHVREQDLALRDGKDCKTGVNIMRTIFLQFLPIFGEKNIVVIQFLQKLALF